MNTEPPEGVISSVAEASAPPPMAPMELGSPELPGAGASPAAKAESEAPRTVRMVPRPSGASASGASGTGAAGPPSRKGTHPGFAAVTGELLGPASAAPLAVPPPTPADIPPPAQMPQLPEAVAMLAAEDAAATERRPAISINTGSNAGTNAESAIGDVGSPPEIRRFLSPLPTPPSAESASGPGSEPMARRRSRRTVKIPDDAVPHKTAPAPAPVASVSPVPPSSAAAPPSAPPLQVIPATPPVPVLSAPRQPPSIPRPAPRPAGAPPASTATPSAPAPEEAAKSAPDPGIPPPAVEMYDVIRPMRIINIGSVPPPAQPAVAETPPVVEAPRDDGERRASRPPLHASAELEAFVVPPPPPVPRAKPPAVEEVEAIAEDEPEAPISLHEHARPAELESIPDDDLLAERISDISTDLIAVHEDIPIDVVLDAPAPKKPPPPPPKRATTLEPPPLATTQPLLPAIASPPPTRAVEALAALPASPVTPAPASPPAPAMATPSTREGAQTLDLSGRKRVKPWWEEIFSDDYLRTMEKVEPKAIKKECDFIEDRLGLEKGAIMLDLACGPGSHAVELASRGYNVVGYDLSLAMLARAQDEAQERGQKINFLQGDMREMAFQEAFDGIYSWSTSFGYFDDEKNVDVLSRMHRGLRQGGMLLLDVANRDYICPRQPSLVWFEGEGCVCMDEMSVDFFSSRLKVKRTVMFEDGRARECEYAIRIYGLHELGKMLHDTGFKVVEVTGHPSHPGVFFGSESPRIIVLAERA